MARSSARRPPHDQLRDQLRERGLRATPARVAVLASLREAAGPLTHAEVVERLGGRGGDPATVFRNLGALTEAGFVRRTDLGDHVWRFEMTTGTSETGEVVAHEHPHFLCTNCGAVECIPELQLEAGRGARVPRAVRDRAVEVQLKGLCDDCAPEGASC